LLKYQALFKDNFDGTTQGQGWTIIKMVWDPSGPLKHFIGCVGYHFVHHCEPMPFMHVTRYSRIVVTYLPKENTKSNPGAEMKLTQVPH
jgi:hypothetical protein